MRKSLLLFIFLCAGAIWNYSSAKWILGERIDASKCVDGATVFIEYGASINFANRFLTVNDKNTLCLGSNGLATEDHVWKFEKGPADVRTGEYTQYLKHVATGQYPQLGSAFVSTPMTPDVISAVNYQILSCGEDIPWSTTVRWVHTKELRPEFPDGTEKIDNWMTNNDGVNSDDNSIGLSFSKDEESYTYLTVYFGTVSNWQNCECNQWNVYEAIYEDDKLGELSDLVDLYTTEFQPVADATDPGFYYPENVNEYYNVLDEAIILTVMPEPTNEECDAMIKKLKAARKKCESEIIPLTEGYYYMVSAYPGWMMAQEVEKAAFMNTDDGWMWWTDFDENNPKFVFYLTKAEEEDEWWLQNYMLGYYVGTREKSTFSLTPFTEGKEEPQSIRLRLEGKYFWTSHTFKNSASLNPEDNVNKKEGTIGSWGGWNDDFTIGEGHQSNLWTLRRVPEEKMEAFAPIKKQNDLNLALKQAMDEAADYNSKVINIAPDFEDSLIVNASSAEGAENQIIFETVRKQNIETADDYAFLLDKNPVTYMQGSNYIQIDFGERAAQYVTFMYDKRGGNENQQIWGEEERPANTAIYATNDTTNGGDWVYIINVDMSQQECPAYASVNLGAPYKYVRYKVLSNNKGNDFFTISEFQVYNGGIDKETSLYYLVPGMQEAVDNMVSVRSAKQLIENATEADVTEMQDAVKAVKELYPDTMILKALVDECEKLSMGLEVGDEIGQIAVDKIDIKTALENAITEAKNTIATYPSDKEKLDAALASLQQAKSDVMKAMNFIEPGKWYFIKNLDATRIGEPGTDDSWCYGNVIYASNSGNTSEIKWGYYDPATSDMTTPCDPKTMWTFVPVEGTEYYYIQNMYSGIYMGKCNGQASKITNSPTPVPYKISLIAPQQFSICPVDNNKGNWGLFANGGSENNISCNTVEEYGPATWTFVEITEDISEAISISTFAMNLTDVFCLPYNTSSITAINGDDIILYKLRKLNFNEDGSCKSMELYKIDDEEGLKPGEAAIIVLGDLKAEIEETEIMVPLPTEVTDQPMHASKCNGIFGVFNSDKLCPAQSAVSTGKVFTAAGNSDFGCGEFTGVISPRDYQGEVTGVETDLIMEFDGKVTGLKNVKNVNAKTMKTIIGVNAIVGKSVAPGVYVTEEGKKVVE
ncbi:MAG: hypothetical protein KBT27_04060 [Prevotellaceae bacterium]|nr:hypothetical protein [Candidatus Faecinaster equi]